MKGNEIKWRVCEGEKMWENVRVCMRERVWEMLMHESEYERVKLCVRMYECCGNE